MLHWNEPLRSLWCAFDAFIADSVEMVRYTCHISWSLSNTLPAKLEPLSSWLLSEPILGVQDTSCRPFIELRLSETADGSSTWKVTNMKKVTGPRTPVTDAMETGSEDVGHGLLLKWTTSGEAVIHRIADLDSEQKPNITWLEVRILHTDFVTVILTDIPLTNTAAKEHQLVNTVSWNQRAKDVWKMYQDLRGNSFNI
jgi:hypothetical protein